MAITEEHRRVRRRKSSSRIDRISDLPDSILCHILSFLPTKSSVATAILARRWRFLWAYVTTLDFQYQNQEIIHRVMLQRRAHALVTFRLDYDTPCSSYQLETWIAFATARSVERLDLYLQEQDSSDLGDLPPCLFTCKTLVELTLDTCGVIPLNASVYLPRLKKLHLIFVQYEADESLPEMLAGCPVLEELEIELFDDMVCCDVSSPTVKRLALNFINERNGGRAGRLEINTPALEYLLINDYFLDHIKCGVLTSLVEADISLDIDCEILYFRPLLRFFDKLCNVKCLELNISNSGEVINPLHSALTTSFRNLTELILDADCRFLSKFLKAADNLETLILYRHSMKSCKELRGWMEPPQQVPTCLSSHLRIVKFAYLHGRKHDFEIIRYLLRNARVLEMMEISYSVCLDSDAKVEILEKITRFQRGSTSCEVDFIRS
ncbi:hypothetical protein ABFS82_14G180500 [Erythranthe guttata]